MIAIWQKWLRRDKHEARALYSALSAQARHPAFYREVAVADRPEGRFSLLVLHMFLGLERFAVSSMPTAGGQEIQRRLIEAFIDDIDQALREMGVGDLAVAPRVKRASADLLETVDAITGALRGRDQGELSRLLATTVPPAPGRQVDAARLGAYLRASKTELAGQETSALLSGKVQFASI